VKTHEFQQRSEAWFEARRGLPTCSRFDKILTAAKGQPSSAQDTLIDELLAESIVPPEQGVILPMTPEMEAGMKLEVEARCYYELEVAKEPVTEVGFMVHESGLFGGSPDALVGDMGGVEIKCPKAATHIGYVREGVLPNDYKCQVHGYMAVSGRKYWDFMSYHRGIKPFILRVERDDFTEKLAAELLRFCEKYNQARIEFGLQPIGGTKS
jgi:hypothetical protein